MRRSTSDLIANGLLSVGTGGSLRRRLSILIFHRVLPRRDEFFPNEPDAERFNELIFHVSRRFNVLALDEAIDLLQTDALPARALTITFDDGYANNLDVAAPILRRHGISAAVFVATAFLDGGCMWNDIVAEACRSTKLAELDLSEFELGRQSMADLRGRQRTFHAIIRNLKYVNHQLRQERARKIAMAADVPLPTEMMLSRAALRELRDQGIIIGAHTNNHPILARMPAVEAWFEIAESKRQLESILGESVDFFAYPNGEPGQDYGMDHVRMVQKAGFRAAFSTADGAAGRSSDIFQLPRFTPWRTRPLDFDLMMARNIWSASERRAG